MGVFCYITNESKNDIMKALVMMLLNTKESTYHPILYFEHPFCSEPGDLTRFKSKGHRTSGFSDRDEAIQSIQPELVDRLPEYKFTLELDGDLVWDGEGIPASVQLR